MCQKVTISHLESCDECCGERGDLHMPGRGEGYGAYNVFPRVGRTNGVGCGRMLGLCLEFLLLGPSGVTKGLSFGPLDPLATAASDVGHFSDSRTALEPALWNSLESRELCLSTNSRAPTLPDCPARAAAQPGKPSRVETRVLLLC